MPLTISTDATADKNTLNSNIVWIDLLEISYEEEETIRVCNNNESVIWDGEEWLAVPFAAPEIEETKDAQVPNIKLSFWDMDGSLSVIVDNNSGAIGATVTLRKILSSNVETSTCEREEEMEVLSASITSKGLISFSLGAENLSTKRCPVNRYLKNHCRYEEFKGEYCGYSGSETECDRTFARCKELENQERFGGQPAIGSLGYQA